MLDLFILILFFFRFLRIKIIVFGLKCFQEDFQKIRLFSSLNWNIYIFLVSIIIIIIIIFINFMAPI